MSNVQREARRDAREYARAAMYYGDGAGTRRKLIGATVDAKSERDPTYARAFRQELSRQDLADHAEKARQERRRHDAAESVRKNTRAIVSGNYQNAQTGVLFVIVMGYVAHQTGFDKVIYEKGRVVYTDLKYRYYKFRNRNRDKVHNIRSVK